MSSELLTVSEAARWAKVSESYLNKARLTGSGPRFVRLGRTIRYRQSDLEAWAQQSAADSTSEYGAGALSEPTRDKLAILRAAAALRVARGQGLSDEATAEKVVEAWVDYLRAHVERRPLTPLDGEA